MPCCSGTAPTTLRIASPQHIHHFFDLTSLSDTDTINLMFANNNPNHLTDWIHLSLTTLRLCTTEYHSTTCSNLTGPSTLYDLHLYHHTLGSWIIYIIQVHCRTLGSQLLHICLHFLLLIYILSDPSSFPIVLTHLSYLRSHSPIISLLILLF